jgi:hypothetical protein
MAQQNILALAKQGNPKATAVIVLFSTGELLSTTRGQSFELHVKNSLVTTIGQESIAIKKIS